MSTSPGSPKSLMLIHLLLGELDLLVREWHVVADVLLVELRLGLDTDELVGGLDDLVVL
jgi:hypothetical protein